MGLSRVRFLVWPIPFSYRGRPLSPVGLDEGRLGMLQESMRELNVYQNDEDATGGDLSTRPTMRVSESRHQVPKLRMTARMKMIKGKGIKGVVVDGEREVQIVEIEMVREGEEAKTSRKVLDLEMSNDSLCIFSTLITPLDEAEVRN